METEQIKQMAEAKALEKYPSNKAFITPETRFETRIKRESYAQAIIDNYKEPERVNEKLLEVLKGLYETTKHWTDQGSSEEKYHFKEDLTKADQAIQSASRQLEKKTCAKCDDDGWIRVNLGDVFSSTLCNCEKSKYLPT